MDMDLFLTKIIINKIFHLQDFEIIISEKEKKHLIITGKNGSGKTILLNAILDFFEVIKKDKGLYFLTKKKNLNDLIELLERNQQIPGNEINSIQLKSQIDYTQKQIEDTFGKVELTFNDLIKLSDEFHNNNFIFAFYEAERLTQLIEPKNPTKPDLVQVSLLKNKKTDQFLNFLSDYKIQEALARNENKIEEADEIKAWFNDFIKLLQEIFEDSDLILKFNYKDYSFNIVTNGKSFKFTQLSAGYSAIIDLVADLIIKMQNQNSLTRAYLKQGIILIDEIETHLHLELQRLILPILTRIFPNIQFIVTTHSPFILSSLSNAVAFDLETRKEIEDLINYSYEALAEGYFRVKSESSKIGIRFNRLKELIEKQNLDGNEEFELTRLLNDFDNIPEALNANIKAAYYELKLKYNK